MDGEPPQEEDFSQIPLVERSQHKNWKARLSAYTDVIAKSAKTASDTDPFFRPYVTDGPLLKKWVTDANVVAQEKGIEAVLAIVQYSGESSSKCRSDVVPALVEKALGATRAGTKRKGTDLCAMFVEVENTGEGVLTDLMPGLDAKQPKVVAGCIGCMKEIIEAFGITAIGNIKPLLKTIPKIFGHSDKTVRAEGSALVLALYTYLGPALSASLGDLKPVQVSELQKSFEALDAEGKGAGTGRPTRFTRKVQREREAAAEQGDDGGDAAREDEAAAAPIDPRDLLDAVDVYKLFPADLDERISSTKWKDRLEALEEVNKVLTAPQNVKIQDNNVEVYGGLAQTLGTKCKSDANVNVVIEAAKVIEGLFQGLGKPFGRFRGVVMPGMLERLKERKATVVEALGKALDAVFTAASLPDIVEDVLLSLKSKNPQVKEGTLRFLHRSLCTTTDAPSKDQVKPMAEALVALLGDPGEPVRTGAADCLGTMMKILGERVFNPYIEGVGELQMGKVKEAFGKAEIRYRAGGAKAAPAKPAAAVMKKPSASVSAPVAASGSSSPPIKASGKFNTEVLDEFAPPARAPPARLLAKTGAPKISAAPASSDDKPTAPAPSDPIRKPAPTAASAAIAKAPAAPTAASKSTAKTNGPSKTLANSPTDPVKYRYTPEDAAAKAQESIPTDYHTKFADAAWKIRLEAGEEMVKWVEEEGGDKVESEVLFRFLSKTPGWGEKNFQVSAKVYDVMRIMAEKSSTFGKPSAALAIGSLSDKLGDLKLKKPAGDALTTFAEKTSLAFVLAQAYEPMTKQKAPKAQADALTWIKQQLTEFGIAGIPLRDLISFVKTALGSPNALVRASATQVLVTVKIFVGGDISGFIEDLNPQLLSTINSEFDKVSSQTAPEPTRAQADLQEVAAVGGKGGKAGGADPLDDLIPRVDLDKLVNQTSVIADSRSDAWKTRKEAFEALNALLDVKSNSRLKGNMGEIAGVLKKAMADTNLAVKMLALGIISKIATGMGQPFDKHTRILTAPVASVCADQKATTRSVALTTLTAMADAAGGLDTMNTGLATALESTNPALRASVLGWMAERLSAEPPSSSADLSPMAGPVISCLEDRNGDVRKGSGAVLPFVVASAGFDFVMDQTSRLKPASKATIVPLIQNARTTAAPAAPAPAAPAATAKSTASSSSAAAAKAPAARAAGSPAPNKIAPKPNGIAPPGRSLAMKALSNAPTIRPPSAFSDERPSGIPRPKVAGLSRPQSTQPPPSTSAASAASDSRVIPYITSDPVPRSARLKRDATRWILESSPKADIVEYLHTQMEPHASPELLQLLFSKDHRAEEDYMAGLALMAEFYDVEMSRSFGMAVDDLHAVQMANVDLTVKYAALKLMSNNTQLANRCLEVIGNVITTVMALNERFSDVEAKLCGPALVHKLGDAKFSPKLTPIFDNLDKIIAGSQVIQLLVQYGLEDKAAGKTCKNESLALIEKAYRKRGSILKVRDDRAFYEALAKCVNDSGTRNAALSVMALLQLQGSNKALNAVIDALPNASKDMLANRRATMATTKGAPVPVVAKVAAEIVAVVSPRTRPAIAKLHSPVAGPSRLAARDTASSSSTPTARGIPRAPESPSRLPKSSAGSPAPRALNGGGRPVSTAMNALPRPVQREAAVFKPSMQPLGRPANGGRPSSNLLRLIGDIRQDDLDLAVNALKDIQDVIVESPETLVGVLPTLVDTLVDEMERAYTPIDNLQEGNYFRLVKHLVQTMSSLTQTDILLKKLTFDDMYSLFDCLTLRLVQSDQMGGHYRELSKFINIILIHVLSQTDRFIIFKTMFRLLYALSADFEVRNVRPHTEEQAQADLVLKCLWKRSKLLKEDFASGLLPMGPMLKVVEDFVAGAAPSVWRRRQQAGIALGDLPLRGVKTVIQKVIGQCNATGQEVYDILVDEFGDNAANTIVYSYIFRLAGRSEGGEDEGAAVEEAEAVQPIRASRPKSTGSHSTVSEAVSAPLIPSASASAAPSATASAHSSPPGNREGETEAARLMRELIRNGNHHPESLDALYNYMSTTAEHEDEVQKAISTISSNPVQTYVRRMLEQRKNQDHPSPSRPDGPSSPIRSPSSRRESEQLPHQPRLQSNRRSLAPRPSSVAVIVDKSAPPDAQLADYKNLFFNRGGGGGPPFIPVRQSQNGREGMPLSEIGGSRDNALEQDVD